MKSDQNPALPRITAEDYDLSPQRYELRDGNQPDAPPCPYGNRYKWIGYDKQEQKYVRFTTSVFKRLIKEIDSGR